MKAYNDSQKFTEFDDPMDVDLLAVYKGVYCISFAEDTGNAQQCQHQDT